MPGSSVASSLLTAQENQLIISMLGHRCQSLAMTVAELYTAGGRHQPHAKGWTYCGTGVICLVKDHGRRSYFFSFYCPVNAILLWEQEVYNGIAYSSPTPFLHTFEAEDCVVGFNFADVEEANLLKVTLMERLEVKRTKLERRLTRRQEEDFVIVERPIYTGLHSRADGPRDSEDLETDAGKKNTKDKKKNKTETSKWGTQRKKLAKKDISTPFDFKHISHVGWNKDRGFDLTNVDPQLSAFFREVGISERQLKHKETREFIYNFIEQNGGMDAVTDELNQRRNITDNRQNNYISEQQVNIYEEVDPTPWIPNRQNLADNRQAQSFGGINGQQQRRPPPPPTPLTTSSGRKPPRVHLPPPPPPEVAPPPPPPLPEVAPPPPPPPEMAPPPPTAEPLPLTSSPSDPRDPGPHDARSHLLQEIRKGKILKHVGDDQKAEGGSRNQLMGQIRTGVQLKSTPASSPGPSPRKAGFGGGLAGALAKALEERTKVLHSDSSGEESSDDDEWKD